MKEKIFVLDANVLLHDPEAIFKFPRHEVAIPVTVLEELDKLKRTPGELGKNARAAIRELASLKELGEGNLHTGLTLQNGAKIRILMEMKTDFSQSLAMTINDNKILMAAYLLFEQGKRVVFVSKDFAARVKADAIGIENEDYENLKFSYETISTGIRHIELEKSLIDHFYKDSKLVLPGTQFRPNEYSILSSQEHSSAVARYDAPANQLVPLVKIPTIWGIKPRNVEQKCAMDALLRDESKLVSLMGPAGTGKTLLALACGLRKVFDEGLYTKILISRPIVPLGRDIGYLPGTKEEKLSSWMQPIFDNLELLCASLGNESTDTLRWVLDSKKIEMEAVTYIRGRSLPKMFIIIDEAQNLTPHEVKTIISRAGDGTKVILAGDPTQIDNPYLDKDSNGLSYTVGKFKDSNLHSNVFLEKTERSELAAQATELM
ncbi:MAG: PhoH family protein [Chlamydiales bacterium]|nr:PhoH family protein [Chlamydiales bacterium]